MLAELAQSARRLSLVVRVTMLEGCSSSLRPRLRRSVPPSFVEVSSRPRSSCAGCSPASPTPRRRENAPALSLAGNR